MMYRRLNALADESLFAQAYMWAQEAPRWFRESEEVFNGESFGDYHLKVCEENRFSVGFFENEILVALMTFTEWAPGLLEVDLSAARGVNVKELGDSAFELRCQFFERGLKELFSFVDSRNKGAIGICHEAGLKEDGVEMYRGASGSKPIRWIRLNYDYNRWLEDTQ